MKGYISSEHTELVNNALSAFYGSYNSRSASAWERMGEGEKAKRWRDRKIKREAEAVESIRSLDSQ